MSVQLHLGDCLAVMGFLPERSVNLIVADLPYGTTNIDWDIPIPLGPLWELFKRVLHPEGCVVLFGSQPFTSDLVMSNKQWFKYELVWDKNKCGSPGLAKYRPMKVHENIIVFAPGTTVYNPQMEVGEPYSRKAPKKTRCNSHGYGFSNESGIENTGTRYPKSILRISRDFSAQQQVHPTQKPVPLLEWIVATYSRPGDTILDPVMGSGSTGIACVRLQRRFVGIENSPQIFELAESRILDAAGGDLL